MPKRRANGFCTCKVTLPTFPPFLLNTFTALVTLTVSMRLGFTLNDNGAYAPEFAPAVTPLLLAVRRDRSRWAVSDTLGQGVAAHSLLGEADGQRFCDELTRRGLRPEDYLPLPVHPWQWDEVILPGYHQAMARGELLLIGPLTDHYLPQQSIAILPS